MSWTLKANTGGATAPSGGTTSPIDTTGANLIVVAISDYAIQPASILSDSKSNTWNALTPAIGSAPYERTTLYYCYNPTVGAGHTFTATSPSGFTYPSINVSAWSGSAASPFDVENGGGSPGVSSIQAGSITPSANGELIIAANCFEHTAAWSIDSGFTITDQDVYGGGNNFGGAMAYFVQTTAAAINPTWTNSQSNNVSAAIASFKVSGAPPAATPTPINLLMQQQGWGQP